jgi:hemolysin activation/secretion protein
MGLLEKFKKVATGNSCVITLALDSQYRLVRMNQTTRTDDQAEKKAAVTLPGTVEKLIPPIAPGEQEKAQISVEGAEPLYREIRVKNRLQDAAGEPVGLKEGTQVEVTIEAESELTKPLRPTNSTKRESNTPEEKE